MRGLWLFSLLLSVHAEDATLTVSPAWSPLYVGEPVSFKCDMNEGDENSWFYKLNRGSDELFPYNQNNTFSLKLDDESSSGEYQCVGQHQVTGEIKCSNNITLTVKDEPKAELRADRRDIPVGGHVTLTCSVNPPSDWTYELWLKENKLSPFSLDASELINGQVRVSQEGIYRCRGHRGNPRYYTYDSDPVQVVRLVTDKAVVTVQPDWPRVYYGESVMVRCKISGANTQWEYEWRTNSKKQPPNLKEFRINPASRDHDGEYQCKGKTSGDRHYVTEWSDVFSLLFYRNPLTVLRVSPSWWSPGSSLTLSCDVEHPSAGWKFYWYKEFRTSSDGYYNTVKILPMSINGTETATITINEPSHTAVYRCEAGRGDPIFYTRRSLTAYVWSADDHHSVSLKVSPERAQHFVSDSVLMTCEGNATNSRVMVYTEDGNSSPCSWWGEPNGPVCNVTFQRLGEYVFWCESEVGSSNAVNLKAQDDYGIILVSPVHSVTEGESVTIGCQLRTGPALSNVSFYKDDKLVQSDGDAEMTISSVSKSDEGFYKCQSSGNESPQSWISITSDSTPTPEGSSPHILLFVGLPVGLLFIILLLVLLFRYKKSKCVFFTRHDEGLNVNESSAVAPPVHQRESQRYSSLLHAHEENIYETIEGREDTEEENPDPEYDDVAPPSDNDVITLENPDYESVEVIPTSDPNGENP